MSRPLEFTWTECDHARAKAGPAGLYGVRPVLCPDCHTMLSLSSEEDREILDALQRPAAPVRFDVKTWQPDWRRWSVVIPDSSPMPVVHGATELCRALEEVCGAPGRLTGDLTPKGSALILGDLESTPDLPELLRRRRLRFDHQELRYDGYHVRHLRASGGLPEVLVIIGANPRGALYGALDVAERIRRGENLKNAIICEAPTNHLRGGYCEGEAESLLPEITTSGYRPTRKELLALAARRVNLLILRECWSDNPYIRWTHLDEVKDVPDAVARSISELLEDMALAREYGFQILFHTAVAHPSWADEQIFRHHPELAAHTDPLRHQPSYARLRRYNPSHPLFHRMLRAEVREILQTYPDVAGLYSWHGYDGAPLGCDRPENARYAYSDRLIDAHLARYEAMKELKPDALYIVDHSGVDFYRRYLEDGLPEDVIFTSFWRFQTQDLLPAYHEPDRFADLGSRWLPQFSSHAEGGVCGFMPVFSLADLRLDMEQFRTSPSAGVFNHHPFPVAAFANPEAFVDISEPYHEAVLAWAWRLDSASPDDILNNWAKRRFGGVWEDVVQAYRYLMAIKTRFLPGQALQEGFVFGWSQPFDWELLDPEAAWEARYPRFYEGLRQGLQTPYGYPPPGDPVYIWEPDLRLVPVTSENLARWTDRFDAREPAARAIEAMGSAVARRQDDLSLARLTLQFGAVMCAAQSYYLWARAGLMYKALPPGKSASEVASLLVRCLAWAYAQLISPTNLAVNWVRWGTRMFREEQCRLIRRKLAAVDPQWSAEPGPLEPALLSEWEATPFPLGWQPETEWTTASALPVNLESQGQWPVSRRIDDVPSDFYKDPHVTGDSGTGSPADIDFSDAPASRQVFFHTPFVMPGPQGRILGIGPRRFGMVDHAVAGEGLFAQCEALALLCCSVGRELPGHPVARIRYHYADGSHEAAPLRYSLELTHYCFPETTPLSQVAWISHTASSQVYHQYRVKGFSYCRLANPFPERGVQRIEIEAASDRAGALIFAITVLETTFFDGERANGIDTATIAAAD